MRVCGIARFQDELHLKTAKSDTFPSSLCTRKVKKNTPAKSHENLSLKNVLRDNIYFHVSVTFSVTTLSVPTYFVEETHTSHRSTFPFFTRISSFSPFSHEMIRTMMPNRWTKCSMCVTKKWKGGLGGMCQSARHCLLFAVFFHALFYFEDRLYHFYPFSSIDVEKIGCTHLLVINFEFQHCAARRCAVLSCVYVFRFRFCESAFCCHEDVLRLKSTNIRQKKKQDTWNKKRNKRRTNVQTEMPRRNEEDEEKQQMVEKKETNERMEMEMENDRNYQIK